VLGKCSGKVVDEIRLHYVDGVVARGQIVTGKMAGAIRVQVGDQFAHASLMDLQLGRSDGLAGGIFHDAAGENLSAGTRGILRPQQGDRAGADRYHCDGNRKAGEF